MAEVGNAGGRGWVVAKVGSGDANVCTAIEPLCICIAREREREITHRGEQRYRKGLNDGEHSGHNEGRRGIYVYQERKGEARK